MKQRPRFYYTESQKALMWSRWRRGVFLKRIAQLFDRNHSFIQMLVHHPCLCAAHRATPAIRKSYHTLEILESYGIRNQPPIALCERSTGEWVQKQDLTPDACWHKIPGPYMFRLEESMAIWKQITCPVRWVAGRDSWVIRDFATRPGDWEARRASFTNLDEQWIEDADHMLHHDQPAEVARIIEAAFPQGSAN